MSSLLPCLCVGLTLPPTPQAAGDSKIDERIDPAKGHLEKEAERAGEKGLALEYLLADLKNKAPDEYIVELRRRLSEKQFAAICIGFGVRGNRDHTVAFERFVNTCVELSPKSKFGFAIWPDDIVASLERALGRG